MHFFISFTLDHPTTEYFNMNVSIGQLAQHITKSTVVCVRSRPKTIKQKDIEETRLSDFITIVN